MLHTLSLYSAVCQLYSNKSKKSLRNKELFENLKRYLFTSFHPPLFVS